MITKLRNRLSRRDKLLWDVMAASGLRVGDALALTRDQALNGAPVRAQKTGKPMLLDLPVSLTQRIREYMRPCDVYVFASRDPRRPGKPITRQTNLATTALYLLSPRVG